jgi:hypothetical protein
MAAALAFIVERHRPDVFSAATQGLTCQACSLLAGMPIEWPCPDRAAVGDLLPDHSNRLLSDSQPHPREAGPASPDPSFPGG